ncbi:hypothetical protein PHLCEN_2v11494, partial [Hermanssonia centrifuga]
LQTTTAFPSSIPRIYPRKPLCSLQVVLQNYIPTLQLPPPSRIVRLRAYKAWLPQFIQKNTTEVPPSFQEWEELSELEFTDTGKHRTTYSQHLQPPQPTQTNSGPTTTFDLDPSLELDTRLANVERSMAELKRKAAEDPDSSEYSLDDGRRRGGRKRRSKHSDRILTQPHAHLSSVQKLVQKQLRQKTKMQVHEHTGIGKNPFPLKHIDNEPPTPEPTEGCMRIAFGEPVNDPNKDTWTITHKEVNFTKRDLKEFGKEVVRTWQQAYKTKRND